MNLDLEKNKEEIEDGDLELFITALGKDIEKECKGTFILKPEGIEKIKFADIVFKDFAKGDNIKITTKINEPLMSVGSASAQGKDIRFDDTKWFVRAAEFSNNMEIYPLTNGQVRVTFTFLNIAKKV